MSTRYMNLLNHSHMTLLCRHAVDSETSNLAIILTATTPVSLQLEVGLSIACSWVPACEIFSRKGKEKVCAGTMPN